MRKVALDMQILILNCHSNTAASVFCAKNATKCVNCCSVVFGCKTTANKIQVK